MKKICETLKRTQLFEGLDLELYQSCCSANELRLFWRGDLIARDGELCPGLIVITEGQASVQKLSANGNFSTLNLLQAGDCFGEELLFGRKRHYQLNLEASSNGKYILVRREKFLELIGKSPKVLNNILCSLSDKIQEQERRINLLSQRSLRQKVCAYLLGLLKDQLEQAGENYSETVKIVSTPAVELPISKEMVARLLAMPRPSFSRELISMEKDGFIRVSGRVIWLLDLQALAIGKKKTTKPKAGDSAKA